MNSGNGSCIQYSANSKSLCCLLMKVNHALVANFDVANVSFKAIRKNIILAKVSGYCNLEILKSRVYSANKLASLVIYVFS